MDIGTYEAGPASLHVGLSDALPEHLRSRVYEISAVYCDPDHRRQGYGTDLMRKACADADIAGITLLLSVDPGSDSDMTLTQLASWHAKFGFQIIQPAPMLMARQPKPSIQLLH